MVLRMIWKGELSFRVFPSVPSFRKMTLILGLVLLDILDHADALPHLQNGADLTKSARDFDGTTEAETTTFVQAPPPGPRKKNPAYMIVFGILACLLFIGAIVVLIKSWRKKKRRQKVARKVAFRENPTGPPLSVPVRMEKVALALKMGDVTTPEKTPEVTPRPTRTTVKFASQTSVRFDEDASQVADQQEA